MIEAEDGRAVVGDVRGADADDVVDGDETDLRFLDGKGKIVGLKEKGLAKKDETGFVLEPA